MGLLDWLTDGAFGGGGLGDQSMGTGVPANPNNLPPQSPSPATPGQPQFLQGFGGGQLSTPYSPNGAPPPPSQPTPPVAPASPPPQTSDLMGLNAAGGQFGAPNQPPPAAPPMPAQPAPAPDPTPAAGPPDPPVGPSPQPVPMPMPRPPGAPQPPAPGPAAPSPVSPTPPAVPGAPLSLAPTAPGPSAPPQTALGRALGIDLKSKDFNTALTGLGSGLTAAGNSKGKSPFQALTSGAGASIEGSAKEGHALEKDNISYLNAAISAQKAGDSATAATNLAAYQKGKLLLEQQKAASDKTPVSKNDSPTQLYLSAQSKTANDPLVKGSLAAYNNALKNGNGPTDPNVVAAKAAYEKTVQEQNAVHLAGVGLHPQTAAQIAQQPGMTQANPVTAGLTPSNIASKLQPGQYYTNPTDGKVYQFIGAPSSKSSSAASSTKKDDADPTSTKKAATDEDDD